MKRDKIETIAIQLWMCECNDTTISSDITIRYGGAGSGARAVPGESGGVRTSGAQSQPLLSSWERLSKDRRNEYRYRAMDLIREKLVD